MRIQRLRRFLTYLTLLALVVMGLPSLSGAQPACPPDGDVDQNGSVTAADALLAFQQALSLAQLSACQQTIADVFPQPANPDGSITASDALCIFQKALSLPSCLDTLPSSNQPPVVDAGPDQSVEAGVMVFLSGTASDPDGTIASYAWTQTGGPAVSLTGSDAATAVFVAPDVQVDETLTFRLTVSDDAGAQASDEVRVTVHPVTGTMDQASAEAVFSQHVSGPIVQTKCVTCHVQDGASGNTRLVFVHATDSPDHAALNLRAFEALLAKVADEGGGSYVLNKIQGVGHGGGVQVSPGTEEFVNMQQFLSLLGEDVAPPAPVTVETLFDTVVMASPRKTLRRAALIFAGRIPTDEEYAAVEGGDESVLRATIRGLMEGPQFHEFLIRASNDRLLTDRDSTVIDGAATDNFVDLANLYHQKAVAVSQGRLARWEWYLWGDSVDFGFRRAPLELIAYVAENDLPYTEILTADYIMANPMAAEAYGASTRFADPNDPFEFRPSRIVSYYRDDESKVSEYSLEFGTNVIDAGDLWTVYPHAGLLNTTVFLRRYPTTATNRNRARARWTYYHFLGLDVEKSASRTTDPVALADTHNPTMHNPACTVCHSVLDPVAGAFQNYGDEGMYKDQDGGQDSLDGLYKDDQGEGEDFEITARSFAERQTVSITSWLQAGTETIRTQPAFDPPREEDSRIWWNPGIDQVTVYDAEGESVARLDPEDFEDEWNLCGQIENQRGAGEVFESYFCHNTFLVEIPATGYYDIEVSVWVEAVHDRAGSRRKLLTVGAGGYLEGDTWYRDMRTPGFDGDEAPHPDNSVQWLARQIVADERFAEAAVKFWWPAIMGSEISEFPEDATDADFEDLLLAANAQYTEMERLASGFRNGFQGSPYTYNLKDLLVEIVLSKWFRADAVTDTDPVRHTALHDAGARRLLTPEELARKTDAVTGIQWGRSISLFPWEPLIQRRYNALTRTYRLLYGSIDSDGVTERARDITSVMAGVARRHAAEMSCPVVVRELYLLPDGERRLFGGLDPGVTPVSEFSASFKVEADSQAEKQTLSLSGPLKAGSRTVSVAYLNDYWDEVRGDRNVYLDRLHVRDATGRIVSRHELEELGPSGDCNRASGNHYAMWCSGSIEVAIHIPASGDHTVDIVVWSEQAGDELPKLRVTVNSDTETSVGTAIIRNKLVELHDKLLGVQVAPDSPDVEAAYRLFVDVWRRKLRSQDMEVNFRWLCDWEGDLFVYEGILDDTVVERENEHGHPYYGIDVDRVDDFLDGIDFSDPYHTAQAWVVVLAAMMMDYRYLYLN